MKNKKLGYLYGLATIVIFSIDLFPAKFLLTKFSPLFVSVVTSLVIGCIFLPIILYFQKYSLRKIKKNQIPLLLSFGILASSVGVYFVHSGLQITPVSEAAFLLQLEVVFGTITAFLWLKEKITIGQMIGIIVMLIGAYFLSEVKGFRLQTGEIFLILGTVAFGITDMMAKKIDSKIPTSILTGLRFLIGGMVLFPFMIGKLPELSGITAWDVFLLIINGFFYLTGVTCLYKTMKYLPAAAGSFFLIPAMFIAAVLGITFLGEHMTFLQWIGGIFIMVGLVIGTK